MVYYIISTVSTFEGALIAREDSGPLDAAFSSDIMEYVPGISFDGMFNALNPHSKIFTAKDGYIYFFSDFGELINTKDLPLC